MSNEVKNETIIKVNHVTKSFKLYFDKGHSLKEKILFWKRNRHEVRTVLKDISFEVHKGHSIGLIGRNGCGKSTLLKMLSRIYYPNKGNIEIKGRVSCLIELGAGFHPDMSGRENIYINASIFGLKKKEIDERLQDIIDFSELAGFIDNPIRTYSSGMYMRLAFAVAINVNANILLIDEILAVGDSNFQAKCFNKLKELKDSGVTIVLVSHSMESIIDFCDECIWIEKGKINAFGPTKKITNEYIKYMADEEVMKSLDEHDRLAINNEINRQNQDKNLKTQLKKRKKGLDSTLDHYGVIQNMITNAGITNDKDEYINELYSNDPIKIKVSINNIDKYKNLNLVIGFLKYEDDSIIFEINSNDNNIKIDSQSIELKTDNLPLPKGTYYLKVGIFNQKLPLDVYNKYLKFEVKEKVKSKGNLAINFSIK